MTINIAYYSFRLFVVLVCCIGCAVSAQTQSIDTTADATITIRQLEHSIFTVKRKELDTKARIERLKIDIQAVEKRWQQAREEDTEHRLLLDSSTGTPLTTKVLWQRLHSYRIDLENASILLDWHRRHRLILRSILSAYQQPELKIDLWNAVVDSIKPLKSILGEESRWHRERLAETQFEASAFTPILSDSTVPLRDRHLIRKLLTYLGNQAASDSLLAATADNLDSLLDGYRNQANQPLQHITPGQWIGRLYRRLVGIWSYPLYTFDGKPLTVSKIFIALIIIILGLKTAQVLSKFLAAFIKKNAQLDSGIVDAGQKLFFYTFTAFFTLYALHIVQVPLTAFTVIGGALALGFGFGSQNILSNFISGIILLIERPVKTGDFIEVESSIGTVETIGLRSVRIRTQGNEHLIIPNSYLLEKPLINWTLSDKIIRLELPVGVMYGSPVRDVKRLLLAAASGVDRINSKPEPFVIFSDFGDSALIFHLVFWSKITSIVDKRIILSQLRFKVVDLFAQAGIVIAFPQRDIHIDTVTPLQVQLASVTPDTGKDHD